MCVWLVVDTAIGFNPPSPCGEGPGKAGKLTIISEFQSTLPVWGGTCPSCRRWPRAAFQSTLPVWGGTLSSAWGDEPTAPVSIHPPRVGRDLTIRAAEEDAVRFQSTLPVWGGTAGISAICELTEVSIHPPRVGRDSLAAQRRSLSSGFNPPSPCGEGQQKFTKILCKLLR